MTELARVNVVAPNGRSEARTLAKQTSQTTAQS